MAKRRYPSRVKAGRTKIPDRVDIQERPEVVEKRTRYADWEADLIEGAKGSGYILSLYERKNRFGQLVKINIKSSESTARALMDQLEGYKVETISYDNGLEFYGHLEVRLWGPGATFASLIIVGKRVASKTAMA